MSKTRNNHYVPQWYQKGFLFNKKSDQLYYLDLKPDVIALPNGTYKSRKPLKRLPPAQCFFQRDLYTTFWGDSVNDEIERHFFGNIDNNGLKAVHAFFGKNSSEWHQCIFDLFSYIDAQKIRTPKGLQWIKKHYKDLEQPELMIEMQSIRSINCSTWLEGSREIVSAKDSTIKFIISDHPVTLYNPAFAPTRSECVYPNDPSIALKGTQTIFPLDMNHCLILTNYEYAKSPDKVDPTEKRTYARNFKNILVNTHEFITSRSLSEQEVRQINFIIKSRANRFVAAAKEEWLYPEHDIQLRWFDLSKVTLPPKTEVWRFGGEKFISYQDGSSHYQDAFGRFQPENPYLTKPKTIREPGRHAPCRCGSGRKYKNCCLNKPLSERSSWDKLSIRERNISFARGIHSILGLSTKSWNDIRRELSDEMVRKIHELYGVLWTPDTDIVSLLPKPDKSLRAIYTGVIDPRTIGVLISLVPYFDEIIVQSPFLNFSSINKEFNPVDSPHQYKLETLKNVMLFLNLMPFIRAGYINFIPNPCDFDGHLSKQMFAMANERIQEYSIVEKDKKVLDYLQQDDRELCMLMLPLDLQRKEIRKINPHLSEHELEQILEYFKYKKQENPLSLLQDDAIKADGGQLLCYKILPNFEIALFLAQITGAFLLTDNHFRWAEINTAQNSDVLTCGAYNEIASIINDKKYILNLDTETSFQLRKSAQTRPFRKSMRSIYETLCNEKPSEFKINELEIKELDKAHLAISKEILKHKGNPVSARFNCLIPTKGIIHNNVLRLLLFSGIEKYVKQVPMAILVDFLD